MFEVYILPYYPYFYFPFVRFRLQNYDILFNPPNFHLLFIFKIPYFDTLR